MDAGAPRWYFSTMRRARSSPVPRVHEVAFHRTKYGPELLVDAAFVRDMPTFLNVPTPHALAFYDILLVTRGRGSYGLDGRVYPVSPGTLFFTRPGEQREWRASGLDGACLFFTEDFVGEAFSDARFLDRWPYFVPERPSAAVALGRKERRFFLERFEAMQREIRMMRKDAPHALRAVLYELLVALGRFYSDAHGSPPSLEPHPTVERFRALVERDFAVRHRVADYASSLGLTPGHLNVLCRRHLRRSASELLRARIALEARRLLAYAGLGAAQVADRLGFADPAYFARFVRRETGASPSRLRHR
jgi:AraC-like DNA-binding protein